MRRGERQLQRRSTFWLVAYGLTILLLGGSIPTPLYEVYQNLWRFSEGMLTVVYAVYVAGILAALPCTGRLSDRVGRRPVLLSALALAATSAVVFATAPGVGSLIVARTLQGLAIGAFSGAATAALTEAEPRGDGRFAALVSTVCVPSGFAAGALLSGALVEYAPRPTVLVYLVYLGLLVPALAGAWAIPETVPDGHQARFPMRLRPLELLPEARPRFVTAAAAVFCAFAMVGLLAALAPSIVVQLLRVDSPLVGGLAVTVAYGASATAQFTASRTADRPAIVRGLLLLVGGLVLIEASVPTGSLVAFMVGATVTGLGHGLTFKARVCLTAHEGSHIINEAMTTIAR